MIEIDISFDFSSVGLEVGGVDRVKLISSWFVGFAESAFPEGLSVSDGALLGEFLVRLESALRVPCPKMSITTETMRLLAELVERARVPAGNAKVCLLMQRAIQSQQ